MSNNKGSQLQMFHHPVVAIILYLLYTWLLCSTQPCLAKDFLNTGEKIIGNTSILVSARQKFALGFFTPSTDATESYLGIWYYQSEEYESTPKTVVWVGNRDNPVVDSTGVFQIRDDGNLAVLDTSGKSYWSTGLEGSSSTNRTVKLMDSGNLVLLDDHFGMMSYMWQSFQHPTDTFLPGMKMDANLTLTSWKDAGQPGSGSFTFKMAQNRYIILKNENQLYWESGRKGDWNSEDMSDIIVYLLTNFTLSTNPAPNNSRYKIKYPKQRAVNSSSYGNTRLQMNSTGELQFLTRGGFQDDWSIPWKAPASFCDRYNACGMFSSCNDNNNRQPCKCLPGFNQISEDEGLGCARKSASCGEDTTFITIVMVKMGNPDKQFNYEKEKDCKSRCLNMRPQCQAYSYASPNIKCLDTSFSTCWIWTQNLTTIQEEYSYDYERNLSVRVDMSDIAPTAKTCKPCGINIVPYPLSTGPNCGDPMFLNFSCNHTTGQLSFVTPNNTYSVTRIDADSRKFIIQVNSLKDYCYSRFPRENMQFRFSIPFNVTNECYGEDEVEVSWQLPLEPTCTESKDCESWNPISNCKATRDGKRCLCNTNYQWDGVSLNCSKGALTLTNFPSKEPTTSEGKSKSALSLILGITIAGVVLLACTIIFGYVWRRKIARKQGMENIERNRGRFYDSERDVKNLIDVGG